MLNRLITQGENVKQMVQNEDIAGEQYEIWINKCIYYIETYYSSSSITKKFLIEYESGTQKNIYYFFRMLNIIKAFKEFSDEEGNYNY